MKIHANARKQVQEIIFSRDVSKHFHPDVHFNIISVNAASVHKHLLIILGSKLSFKKHVQFVLVNPAR